MDFNFLGTTYNLSGIVPKKDHTTVSKQTKKHCSPKHLISEYYSVMAYHRLLLMKTSQEKMN